MIVNSTRDCIFFMLRNNFEFMLRDSCFVKKKFKTKLVAISNSANYIKNAFAFCTQCTVIF
jgi:hypothetical protein